MTAQQYLICPNDRERLVEHGDDDSTAVCPRCGYNCQNFLKYPVAQTFDISTGEIYSVNVLTGEKVT